MNVFIYGENSVTSKPFFYKRNEVGEYESIQLEPIVSYLDFEDIAPALSDDWEDLIINDFFQESLIGLIEQENGSEETCD